MCPLTDIDKHHQRLEASPAADIDLDWNSDIEEDVETCGAQGPSGGEQTNPSECARICCVFDISAKAS